MEQDKPMSRALAGKALAAFLAVMALLTLSNRMLEEMTIATISRTTTQRGALEKQFTGSGSLEAARTVPVVLTDSARILDVPVVAGSHVEAGDALLVLSYQELVETKQDAVSTAKDSVASKQRALDWSAASLSTTTLSRLQERLSTIDSLEAQLAAAKESGAEKATVDRLQYDYDTEKKRLDADSTVHDYITKSDDLEKAKKDLETAEKALADMLALVELTEENGYIRTVTAPVSGNVLTVNATVGSMVTTSGAVVTLSDTTQGLALTVTVDEDTAEELAVGDKATITVSSTRYDAQILNIAASASRSGYFDLTFLLPGDAGAAGAGASMSITKRTQNYDLIIPLSSLYSDSDGDYVFVVEQSQSSLGARMTVRRVDVYVLDKDGSRAALQGGVTQRDSIVVRSDRAISDGDRVRLEE